MVFEQDHVVIERAKALEDIDLRTFGIDFQNMRLGQSAWRLGLDLHKCRRLLADIVETRFAANVAAEMKPGQFRIANGKIVEADRLSALSKAKLSGSGS